MAVNRTVGMRHDASRDGIQVADRHGVGRDDAAEPQAEHGGDGEQPGLVLGQQEGADGDCLKRRSRQHCAQPAVPVGERAPALARDERAAQHHRQHDGAMAGRDTQVAAERHQMGGRQCHRHAAAEAGDAQHHHGRVRPQSKHAAMTRSAGDGRACGQGFRRGPQQGQRGQQGEHDCRHTPASSSASR